ncbi:MAG: hypothetical protein AAFU77_06185 [Myxococcota bacterium]
MSAPSGPKPVPEFTKSAAHAGGGVVFGDRRRLLVLGEEARALGAANESVDPPRPTDDVSLEAAPTLEPVEVVVDESEVTAELLQDEAPAVETSLAGAFARLPPPEPRPAPLPDHVDVDAKPTHTFGASALQDAVALLAGEPAPPPPEPVSANPPTRSGRRIPGLGIAVAVLVVSAVYWQLSGKDEEPAPVTSPRAPEPVLAIEVDETLDEAAAEEAETSGAAAELEPEPTDPSDSDEARVAEPSIAEPIDPSLRREKRRRVWRAVVGGKHRLAVERGREYAASYPFDWELHIKLAHSARRAGLGDQALEWFRSFVTDFPGNKYQNDAAFWIAQLTWQIHGIDQAIAELEQVADDEGATWRDAAETELRRLLRRRAK